MKIEPFYETALGQAYLGDSLAIMRELPAESVNLIVTSPPFPLITPKRKPYEAVTVDHFIDWFLPYAEQGKRLLKQDGSFAIDIGGVWNRGTPTRSLYQYRLLLALCDRLGFSFAQDLYWYNPAALPAPTEWVNVRRVRVKCAVDLVWWLSKTPWPKADNRNVLKEYSDSTARLVVRGRRTRRSPSGHLVRSAISKNLGGSIPPNLLDLANTSSTGGYFTQCKAAGLPVHPARFPRGLPEFFIKLCTDPDDMVLDPFAGSNVTGEAAERLSRHWIAIEICRPYLEGSKSRFTPRGECV